MFSAAEWLYRDTGGSRDVGTDDDDIFPPKNNVFMSAWKYNCCDSITMLSFICFSVIISEPKHQKSANVD